MRLSRALMQQVANRTRFQPDQVEKVLRLQHLLNEIFRHPYLRPRFVLKGGTALNLFHFPLPRLSVDIDLNYIGSLDREVMMEEREPIQRALGAVFQAGGYDFRERPEGHAGHKYELRFTDALGSRTHLAVDCNYLWRTCVQEPQEREAHRLEEHITCRVPVLALEELFAGKLRALLDRGAARDLFDLYQLLISGISFDRVLLKKIGLLFAATLRADVRVWSWDRLEALTEARIAQELHPVLRIPERPARQTMLDAVRPLVAEILTGTEAEREFLNQLLDTGVYRPALLFSGPPELVQRLERHPALLWKALNVREFRSSRD